MRFHIGCSFRPKTLIKYIGLGFLGLLAFFGISNVNAAEIPVYEISAGDGSNNYIYCNSNFNDWCPGSFNEYRPPYNEVAPIKYINFDFTENLVANHSYTFDIVFDVARPVSLNDFEQESYTFWPYSGSQLIDTTITWTKQDTYEYQTGIYYSYFHYRGQFTPSVSSSGFYTRLTLEQNEALYGIIVLSVQLVDNDSGDALIDANYENTQNIINNANNNTNNIINNNNSNTQEIKDTINDNLQSCRNSLNLYQYGDYNLNINFYFQDKLLLANFKNNTTYTLSFDINTSVLPYNLSVGYGDSSSYLVDGPSKDFTSNGRHYITFTTNRNDYSYLWIRLPRYRSITQFNAAVSNIMLTESNMVLPYEPYGQQICSNKIDNLNDSINNTNQSIQDLNDTISDDTIDTSSSNDFFDNFEDNHHGLSGIISLPLTTIQSLNNSSCTPLTLTIPYLQSNNTLQLPCLTPIYENNFGIFFTLYQTIIFGFVSYYVCVSIFYMVKDFKDPNKDKIEVIDL